MQSILPIISVFLFSFPDVYAQSEIKDSCNKMPYYKAFIEGVEKADTLSLDQFHKIKKLVPGNNTTSIIKFTVTFDCDGCSVEEITVYGDTIPEKYWFLFTRIIDTSPNYFISFTCLVGKMYNGRIISYEPFWFYLKE